MPGAQVANESREQSFGRAHRLKCEVCDIVPNAVHRTEHFIPRERGKVNVLQNEFDARDAPVEAGAHFGENARAATLLIPRERKKTGEERERDGDEEEVCHGSSERRVA